MATSKTKEYVNPWLYKGVPYSGEINSIFMGMVYVITNKSNGKMYIGKKLFWSKKTLPPLKGNVKKRKSIVESDWKSYYGSSILIKNLLKEEGESIFYREILHFGKTKGELGYLEAQEQFDRKVLLDDNYYNGIISCRIHRSHVNSLKEDNNV